MLWSWILKQSNLEEPREITSFRLVNESWNQILVERDYALQMMRPYIESNEHAVDRNRTRRKFDSSRFAVKDALHEI